MQKLVTAFLCFALLGGLGYVTHVVWQSPSGAGTQAETASAASATQNQNNVVVTEDETPAPEFSAPINPSPNETTAPSAVLSAPRVSPSGQKEYRNDHYGFRLLYPDSMQVSEYKEGGDATTITFESNDAEFEIFITPYGKRTVSADQFKRDEPSGATKDLKNITIDGVRATAFFGQNPIMGDTREIWFTHGDYLFEIETYWFLNGWLAGIMKTWKFL